MRLQDNLVLFEYITSLLGGDYSDIAASLKSADEGRRPDGQSNFFGVFESRSKRLKLDSDGMSLDKLKMYDLNILTYERALARHRPEFRLKYFQYLAALYTEVHLDRFTTNPARLLIEIEDFRKAHFAHMPPYQANDLRKLAFWMATGAGKTLLLHINLLQFRKYRPVDPQNIILLTPTESLSRQHLEELHLSGFQDARHALDADPGYQGIQVLEITKLYVDTESRPKGGVSLPTSVFEGKNLLLVDEGHKGTTTSSDLKEETTWRARRNALVSEGGFTFEYSATFAQVTEGSDELLYEYSRSILYEYAYAQFHADGYGKDFHVINLRQEDELYGDTLLMGGLLTFYEQRRLYDEMYSDIQPYNIQAPLMVFVGQYVTAGSEVLQTVVFLNRVLTEPEWSIDQIDKILFKRDSGLPGEDGEDVFASSFPYLKRILVNAEQLYNDLCERLLFGHGGLVLQLLNRADGEIGIRTSDSAKDAYCGVINVGDASGFIKKVGQETDINIGIDDHISDSLFAAIESPNSTVNFLIGSKKFVEGWSSWRVSLMGLLKVGRSAGAQVLQLFGRGIRLQGLDMTLRRSESLPGNHPSLLSLLETLSIFGFKANYLDTFLKTLDREGVEAPITRMFPIEVDDKLDSLGLNALEVSSNYSFKRDAVVIFDPHQVKVSYDLMPRITIGSAGTVVSTSGRVDPQPLSENLRSQLPYESLFYHALDYKAAKGWENLYITRPSIRKFYSDSVSLALPAELTAPSRPEHWHRLETAAQVLLERGLDRFYYQVQREAETKELVATTVTTEHPNIPQIRIINGDSTEYVPAYQLKIPPSLLKEVEALIANQTHRLQEALDDVLPRLHLDFHLYWPLLMKENVERLPDGTIRISGRKVKVSSTPTGLEESEIKFVMSLRDYWQANYTDVAWSGYHVYLLRNLPKKGVGFFQTAGFYPDFLLWLTKDNKQVLAFVDPKGLAYGSWQKVQILQDIPSIEVGFPLLGYIVTSTPLEQIPIPDVEPDKRIDWLSERRVLLQSDGTANLILQEMKVHLGT